MFALIAVDQEKHINFWVVANVKEKVNAGLFILLSKTQI